MKKFAYILSALFITTLTGCTSSTRSTDGLPQSTRIPRSEVERLALATLNATQDQAAATESATFYTDANGRIVFHVWTQTDPEHPLSAGLLNFKEEVERRSNGELIVDVRVSAGNDGDLLNMVVDDSLDGAVITVWSAWSGRNELANLESLPFLFTNYDEAWRAYEASFGDWVTENVIDPSGVHALGYWTNGLRHFTNNVRPINAPEDLVGLRMRSMNTSTQLETYATLGAASISLPFGQVHAGLAAGDFDGQDNPLGNIYAANLFEVQRYLSLSGHMYSAAPVIVSEAFWNSLSTEHQQVIKDSTLASGRFQGQLTRDLYQSQIQSMTDAGMVVNEVNISAFEYAVIPVWNSHMARFGNEIATIASRYVSDPNALVHRFGDGYFVPVITPSEVVGDDTAYEDGL